jgi:hypothetical protein
MLVMIVHGAMPIREIDDQISALMFLVVLFMWIFMFNFVSLVKIINLEKEFYIVV